MSTVKLEIKGNFLKVTDNINDNDEILIAGITKYFFSKGDTILNIRAEQGTNQVTYKYKVSVLVDETNTPFASLEALETFLSDNLGKTSSPAVSGGGFENRTINTRWTLTTAGVYYRTRSDAWGYVLNPITISTGAASYAATPSTQLSNQNCFMHASKDSVLDKVSVDFSSIGADVTQWKICLYMGQRTENTVISNSVVNLALLHEETLTKTVTNALTASFELNPTEVTIPEGYLINVMLQRIDGTASETNVSISATLRHI